MSHGTTFRTVILNIKKIQNHLVVGDSDSRPCFFGQAFRVVLCYKIKSTTLVDYNKISRFRICRCNSGSPISDRFSKSRMNRMNLYFMVFFKKSGTPAGLNDCKTKRGYGFFTVTPCYDLVSPVGIEPTTY
jgi:hypothetical protein